MKFEEFTVGLEHREKQRISQEAINAFATLSGDKNPLHIDQEFAKNSIFGKPIAHGIYGLSLISAALGMNFPGFGTIYMGQEAKFFKPIFIGEEIEVFLKVKEIKPEKKRMVITTQVIKENGEIAIDGEAKVQYDPELLTPKN